MVKEMRRAHPGIAKILPPPKEVQSAINTAKISNASLSVGTRPIRAGAEGKLSARQILKGHPFCEIRPDRVKHELTNYLQERYDQGASV